MLMMAFASQDQYALKRLLTHKKFDSSACWYVVNRWDPFTLDPTYDISNKRESFGESICLCQNGSISKSYSVTGLVLQATKLYLLGCIILSVPSLVLV